MLAFNLAFMFLIILFFIEKKEFVYTDKKVYSPHLTYNKIFAWAPRTVVCLLFRAGLYWNNKSKYLSSGTAEPSQSWGARANFKSFLSMQRHRVNVRSWRKLEGSNPGAPYFPRPCLSLFHKSMIFTIKFYNS